MQREDDNSASAAPLRAAGGLVSGGALHNFREGWATVAMPMSSKAHYFRRNKDFGYAVALCGTSAQVRWLFGRGDFGFCQRCAAKVRRLVGAIK